MSQPKIDEMPDLSRAEFADAIAKGLGRALLYIQNHGLDRVKDLVLNACFHDISYDPQIEKSRAKWLFSMFADSLDYLEFRDAILGALAVETEIWDLLQLCELAREMALAGDTIAADRLANRVYQYAAQPSCDDWIGANELIEVRGIDALLELSRIYGRRLLDNSDDFVPEDLAIFTDRREEIVNLFDRYAATDTSIATYYQYLIDRQIFVNPSLRESPLSTKSNLISIETIIEKAKVKQYEYPGIYARFGYDSTAPELETILELLVSESDKDICLRLLWIFWRTPLPRLVDRLFDWADSNYDKLRMAAVKVISQTSDDRTPCSCCRERAVIQLEKYQLSSEKILAEYQFDAVKL